MLGWRWEMRQQALRVLRELSKPLLPLVIYLQVDRQVALHRALDARGEVWFNRYAGRSFDEPVTPFDVSEVASVKRGVESARRAELVGWPVTIVDGNGTPAGALDSAWQAVSARYDIDGTG